MQILLINLLLGILGFIFYSLWDSRHHFNTEKGWIFIKFLSDNLSMWIFNFIFILIIAIVIHFDSTESLKKIAEFTGLELTNETLNGGFFIVGFTLTPLTKRSYKKPN